MTEYFQLAYEFGKLKAEAKSHNPYIYMAMRHLEHTVGSIRSWCYDYRLKPQKSRSTQLIFRTTCEYWMPYDTIVELYSFFDYFPQMLPALKKEVELLRKVKVKTTKRKQQKNERRKAA
jgi:hypothetical protein